MRVWKADHPWLQWSFVAPLASNDITKIVTVVPIVGYLIIFNDGFANSVSFHTIAGYTESEGSPFIVGVVAKLRLAFFGSIFVLVANILFRVRGPRALKSASNDLEFCERVFSSYSRPEIVAMEETVTSRSWKLRSPLLLVESNEGLRIKDQTTETRLSGLRTKQYMIDKYPDYLRLLAREWWAGEMHSHPFARYLTLVLAILGYAMLSVPTLDIFQAVLRDIF